MRFLISPMMSENTDGFGRIISTILQSNKESIRIASVTSSLCDTASILWSLAEKCDILVLQKQRTAGGSE